MQSSAHEDWSEFVENSDTLSNNELHTQTDKVVLEDKTQDYQKHYITKGQRGMSRLLEKASEEAQSSNKDITNRVRHIGNKFSECSLNQCPRSCLSCFTNVHEKIFP